MSLNEEELLILRVLADDWDNNPANRTNGVHSRKLGALVGSYLNNPLYSIANLRYEGFVGKFGNQIVLTDKGYTYIRDHSYTNKITGKANDGILSLTDDIEEGFSYPLDKES